MHVSTRNIFMLMVLASLIFKTIYKNKFLNQTHNGNNNPIMEGIKDKHKTDARRVEFVQLICPSLLHETSLFNCFIYKYVLKLYIL